MADTSHLEKMGRELKCPICLSLLDSSVSLTCNHVFCNLCIHKSMKSGSYCPVCKVPYQRREIRPAPHMDSLVNIYKSMKVASKTPLHVTQEESTSNLDKERHTNKDLDSSLEKIDEEALQMIKLHEKTETSKRSKLKAKNSDHDRGKSSFSMNKRVQVPQSPSTETPLREAKEEHEKKQTGKNVMNDSAAPPCEHPLSNRKESPGFLPFFWLRDDDDAEKSTQQTNEELLTCTPANIPSFSDIKDTDDERPTKLSPRAPLQKCVSVELFDSEMFEWTQRPCSPELCPSPSKMQIEETNGFDGMCGKEFEAPSNDAVIDREFTAEPLDNVNIEDCLIHNDGNKLDNNSCSDGSKRNQNESKLPQKRGNKGSKRNQNKRQKVNVDKHGETHDCSNSTIEVRMAAENNLQQKIADVSKGVTVEVSVPAQNSNQNYSNDNDLGDHIQTDMPTLRKCSASSTKCAFCLTTEQTEASGEMFHYAQGKPVPALHKGDLVIHTHKNCAEWAPNVYFEDDVAVNLEEELARSRRIKCSLCGVKGAALGCYEKRCSRSFHVPCAKKLRECRWDTDHFVILCPLHASSKLPCEKSISQVKKRCDLNVKHLDQRSQLSVKCANSRWSCGRVSDKIIMCGSALTADEKEAIFEFAKSSGVALFAHWNPTVTHVIASTIESGACKRTLKVLKGILEGKWILSIKWVQACMKATKLVEESPYEISCDIYGIKNGPYLGRLRLLNKQPKLFTGFKFYLTGDFQPSYTTYLQDLVTTAGGTILHRKPIIENSSSEKPTLIIYAEQPDKCHLSRKDLTTERRRSDAEALVSSSGARVAHNAWVFNCIAGHKLLTL